jgi:hypothetical protein
MGVTYNHSSKLISMGPKEKLGTAGVSQYLLA